MAMLLQRKATKEIDPEQKKRTVDEIARRFPNVLRALIEKYYVEEWNKLAKDAKVFEHIPNLVKKGVIGRLESEFGGQKNDKAAFKGRLLQSIKPA